MWKKDATKNDSIMVKVEGRGLTSTLVRTCNRVKLTAFYNNVKVRNWLPQVILLIIATPLRFLKLGNPETLVFDETYYVKDAWALLRFGYERNVVEDADLILNNGSENFLAEDAAYVVHPPVGKWVIAFGEFIFGLNPFGWRAGVALLGVLAVIMVYKIMILLNATTPIAFLAGLAMAVDGIAIVMSRTALLDQTLMFAVLVSVWAAIKVVKEKSWRYTIVMSFALGLATATKWSGLWYAIAIFIIIFITNLARKNQRWLNKVGKEVSRVLIGGVILLFTYILSWGGWLLSSDGWGRDAVTGVNWLPQPLRALLEYHKNAYNFHTQLTAEHPYSSDPLGWLLMLRPTSFWYTSNDDQNILCESSECAGEVLALGNVVIWWVAVFAAIVFLGMLVTNRLSTIESIGVLVPLLALAAGWAPWFFYRERTTFNFYIIVVAPYICMIFAWFVSMIWQPSKKKMVDAIISAEENATKEHVESGGEKIEIMRQKNKHLSWRSVVALLIVITMLLVSIYFYPIWSGMTLSKEAWQARMWFNSWV